MRAARALSYSTALGLAAGIVAAVSLGAASTGCGSYAGPSYFGESLLVVRGVISNPEQAPVEPGVELSLVWDGTVVAGSSVVEPRLPSDFVLTLYAPPVDNAVGEIVVLAPAQLASFVAGVEVAGSVGRADRFRVEYNEGKEPALGRNGFQLVAQHNCAITGPCDAPFEPVPLETPINVVIHAPGDAP